MKYENQHSKPEYSCCGLMVLTLAKLGKQSPALSLSSHYKLTFDRQSETPRKGRESEREREYSVGGMLEGIYFEYM